MRGPPKSRGCRSRRVRPRGTDAWRILQDFAVAFFLSSLSPSGRFGTLQILPACSRCKIRHFSLLFLLDVGARNNLRLESLNVSPPPLTLGLGFSNRVASQIAGPGVFGAKKRLCTSFWKPGGNQARKFSGRIRITAVKLLSLKPKCSFAFPPFRGVKMCKGSFLYLGSEVRVSEMLCRYLSGDAQARTPASCVCSKWVTQERLSCLVPGPVA